jgi:hypothetical protein
VYRWDRDGRRTNLSAANPLGLDKLSLAVELTEETVAAHGDQVLLRGQTLTGRSRLTLHDRSQALFSLVVDSRDAGLSGSIVSDFAQQGEVARVVYGAMVAGASPSRFVIREWRSDTGATRLLAEGPGELTQLRTDGERAYWLDWTGTSSRTPDAYSLRAINLAGGAVQTLVAPFPEESFELQEDRSLSWGTSLLSGGVVRTAPSGQRQAFAAGYGWVFYVQPSNNTLYAWNAATGVTEPVFDANAQRGYMTGGHLVFQYLGAVYRIPLNR